MRSAASAGRQGVPEGVVWSPCWETRLATDTLVRDVLSAVLHGLTSGAGFGAVSLPFVLVARATGVFNFAYAPTVIFAGIGAAMTIGLNVGIAQWIAIAALWTLVGAGFGVATYFVAVMKVEKTSTSGGSHLTLVTTLSVGLILETIAYKLWGAAPPPVPSPIRGEWHVIGDLYITFFSLTFLVLVVILGLLSDRWLRRTDWGLLWRAMGENRALAESRGINSILWSTVIFGLGGALSAFAGVGLAVQTPLTPFSGLAIALNAFLVLGLVGVDSLRAAIGGGLFLGVVEAFLQLAVGSNLRDVLVIVMVAVVLAISPNGLFGSRPIREV